MVKLIKSWAGILSPLLLDDLMKLLNIRVGPNGPKTLILQLSLQKLSSNQVIAKLLNIVSTQKLDDLTLIQIQSQLDQFTSGNPNLPKAPQSTANAPSSVTPLNSPYAAFSAPRAPVHMPVHMPVQMPAITPKNMAALLKSTSSNVIVKLDQQSIQKQYPLIHTLYSSLDFSCKQCALRFLSAESQKKHLDWHFRASKRKMDLKRTTSRPWYLSVTDWIDEIGGEPADAPGMSRSVSEYYCLDSKEILTLVVSMFFEEVAPSKVKEYQEQPIPAVEETTYKCAVCHDEIGTYYDNDHEEWMIRASLIDGLVFNL